MVLWLVGLEFIAVSNVIGRLLRIVAMKGKGKQQ